MHLDHAIGLDKTIEKTHSQVLNKVQLSLVEKGIMPVAVPVLKKDAVQLVIHAAIRGAQVHRHLPGRVRMDVEPVDAPGLDRDLSVLGVDLAVLAVELDAHDARLDAEVLGLELVKMQKGTLWPPGALDQPPEVLGHVGAIERLLVRLPEEKTAAWWRLQEFCCQEAAKSN